GGRRGVDGGGGHVGRGRRRARGGRGRWHLVERGGPDDREAGGGERVGLEALLQPGVVDARGQEHDREAPDEGDGGALAEQAATHPDRALEQVVGGDGHGQ